MAGNQLLRPHHYGCGGAAEEPEQKPDDPANHTNPAGDRKTHCRVTGDWQVGSNQRCSGERKTNPRWSKKKRQKGIVIEGKIKMIWKKKQKMEK